MTARRLIRTTILATALLWGGASGVAAGDEANVPNSAGRPAPADVQTQTVPQQKTGSVPDPDVKNEPHAAALGSCGLKKLADLDMGSEVDGMVTVPVTLNDLAGRWLVDTGNIRSMISDATVKTLNIDKRLSDTPMQAFGGRPVFHEATVSSVHLGPMGSGRFALMVAPADLLPGDTIGMLSPDIMAAYDVEFDFAAGRFKMFSQDHCPGKVVYWTKSKFTEVPFDFSSAMHIIVQVKIDGKEMDALIDTGAGRSSMSLRALQTVFKLDAKSPSVAPNGNMSINGLAPTPTYNHPFRSLTFGGMTIKDPGITIVDDEGLPGATPRLVLGVQTLRQLHLYIAYRERKLYLTQAEDR